MFHIVDFKGGKKRTVVPDTWLSINDTSCILPSNATDNDLEVLVRYRAEPVEGWQLHDVSSVETFETYLEAKKQLEKSREKLILDTSPRRKRKKPGYLEEYRTHDSDDGQESRGTFTSFNVEDSSENEWIPSPEFVLRREKMSSSKKLFYKGHRQRSSQFSQIRPSSEREFGRKRACMSSCETHSPILPVLYGMQKQLNRNTQSVQQLLEQQKSNQHQPVRFLPNKPITHMTPEEMDVFLLDDSNSAQNDLQNQKTTSAEVSCIKGEKSSNSEDLENQNTSSAEDSCINGEKASNPKPSQCNCNSAEDMKFLKTQLCQIKTIMRDQAQAMFKLTAAVNHLLENSSQQNKVMFGDTFPFKLPCETMEELMKLEEAMKDEKIKKDLFQKMTQIGGNRLGNTLRRMMATLMTNEVAVCFSWFGAKGKESFSDLKISKILFYAVRNIPDLASSTDRDIETAIKDWLRHAKARLVYVVEKKQS